MARIRIIELFAGIGACSKALTNLGIEHEIVDAVEIDKYAIKSFNAIHGTNFEPQDITKWNKNLECDLIMHGSPCQDFSVAGKNAGGDEGSGTRSSLMYETLRIVEKLKPKYVIWENVKNLLSKKHRHNFDAYLEAMEELGYVNFYQVLNAKDYGIPQNRERVFTVSIREDIAKERYFRSATAMTIFEFPEPIPLKKKLKDVLEKEVDEKYYIKDATSLTLGANFDIINGGRIGKMHDISRRAYHTDEVAPSIHTCSGGNQEPKIVASRGRGEHNKQHLELRKDNLTNTITSVQKDNYVAIKTANKKGYDIATDGDGIDLAYPESETRRGRVGHKIAKTLPTSDSQGVLDGCRIRKLTPLECWRLMGFDDADFYKAEKVNSNTQLYKQAGNSIVVNVLMAMFRKVEKNGEK